MGQPAYVWDKRFLDLAKVVGNWSKDSTKIGAVVVGKNKEILAQGYNGFPRGIEDSQDRLDDRETKLKYVVHAEMNCIYNASHNGVKLKGSTIYVSGLPTCSDCAKGIIQVGIKRVVMVCSREVMESGRWGRDGSFGLTMKMFDEAGVDFLVHYEEDLVHP